MIVLAAVAAVSLAQSKATFDRVEGRRVTALAEELAGNPLVRTQLVRPAPAEMLAPLLQSTLTRSGVTSATVSDADGEIVASTNPTLVGTRMPSDGPQVTDGRGWAASPSWWRRRRCSRRSPTRTAASRPGNVSAP